ncbi:MAG: diaminopimelate epimerase [Burkholderiaceae bacterium]|nr:diaminopimelate epimerase [Burkholderiaceae bacterium]
MLSSKLRFTKMHGAGNDFVVIDGVRQPVRFSREQWRCLADRHLGVGADQILLVEPSPGPGIDFRYRIFNADGDEVEQCGNGARCFARFVLEHGLTDRRTIRVQTLGGIIEPAMEDDGRVRVDMGVPAFGAQAVGFDAAGLQSRTIGDDTVWILDEGEAGAPVSLVSIGNPHAVQFVDDVDDAPVTDEGARLSGSARFARGVNAGYAQIVSPHELRLRVFERGAGETLACGTGACAAALAGIRQRRLHSPVDVRTRGGRLRIDWDGTRLALTGPARTVFEGEIDCATIFDTDCE